MDNLTILKRVQDELRGVIVQLYDDLIRVTNGTDEELFYARFYYSDQASMQTVTNFMIENLLPCKEKIVARDRSYFFTETHIFRLLREMPVSKVDYFRKMFSVKDNTKNENVVWSYFDNIIKLLEIYKAKMSKNFEMPFD
jgi:hypothetical protein